MKAIIAFLMGLSSASVNLRPTLINGSPVDRKEFPEVVYVRNDEFAFCTATIIGPEVILTAAHCVGKESKIFSAFSEKVRINAKCAVPDDYLSRKEDHDIALCVNDRKIKDMKPASLSFKPVKLGQKILLMGYGCTGASLEGGNDGTLRIGISTVKELPKPPDFDWFLTHEDAALCSGDSGGPAMLISPAKKDDGHHYVLGVNSRSNLHDTSLMTALSIRQSRSFLTMFAKKNDVEICGVNIECNI